MEEPSESPEHVDLEPQHVDPEPQHVDPEPQHVDGLQLVPRSDWNALSITDGRPLPVATFLLFGNTKTYTERLKRNVHNFSSTCTDSNREKVRAIQDFDSRFFGDIRFSFLIGGDGKVYEGRGWERTPSLPKKYQSMENNCLFIGMLEPIPDSAGAQEMLRARHNLIREGVARGRIKANCLEISMNNKFFWTPFRKFLSRL